MLRLSSAQRETLSGTRQAVIAAAVLLIAVTGLTLLRIAGLGGFELAALAAGVLYIAGLIVGSRALARAQSLDGADLGELVRSLRWLGVGMVFKALGLVLTAVVLLAEYRRFRP